MITVTLVTTRANAADDLADADYRAIYDELRSKCSLRKFAEFIGSQVSFAWWSAYERDATAVLSRERRNELRAAVGLSRLPATVAEACAAADPDAAVYQIGAAPADRVLLVGADLHQPLDLRLNGALSVAEAVPQNADVTPLTRTHRRSARVGIHLSTPAHKRANAARVAAGMSWDAWSLRGVEDEAV